MPQPSVFQFKKLCRARQGRHARSILPDIFYDYPQKYPLVWGQRRAFSGQKARQCVPQCILGGVAVLFTVRKHACTHEAMPRLNIRLYNTL